MKRDNGGFYLNRIMLVVVVILPATAHVVETQYIELDYHLQDISVLLQVFLQFLKHVEQQLFY